MVVALGTWGLRCTPATAPPEVKTPDSTKAFEQPAHLSPQRWMVLGPFPAPPKPEGQSGRSGIERDFLMALGGESGARLSAAASVELDGKKLSATAVESKDGQGVDFVPIYKSDTDMKVAYAYGEFQSPRAGTGHVRFGSDDAAVVWLNGKRVHDAPFERAVDPDSDRFEVPLVAGTNRVLVKVDNGSGGWGFAFRVFDENAAQRLEALAQRRELESADPGPDDNDFLLDGGPFPAIGWRGAETARLSFGDRAPSVRWFGPDMKEATHAKTDGRYVALVSATTIDGAEHHRMLSFARVPPNTVPWFQALPGGYQAARVPPPPLVQLNPAQQAEFSGYVWASARRHMQEGEGAASFAATLVELGAKAPPAGEPEWLSSSFVRNAEHQLALRIKLEGRTPKPLAPPEKLAQKAGVLRKGGEAAAGMKPGSAQRIRELLREWAKADPHGFTVLLARRGVIFMHEGFNGFKPESRFWPASIGKSIGGLLFARAVDQKLVELDQPVGSVSPAWADPRTAKVTFRHLFNHVAGLEGHGSHGGLFNTYLDEALATQDAYFTKPLTRFIYNGDDMNLTGKALELITGQSVFRLLHENLQKPFAEDVSQLDLGAGDAFNTMYLAKLGQMLLQDGAYGDHRLYSAGFLPKLWPQRIADHAPDVPDKSAEWGIGFTWMTGPGERAQAPLGPNVVGHGAASGSVWRIALDHQLVIVVGRNEFDGWGDNEAWVEKLVARVAENLQR